MDPATWIAGISAIAAVGSVLFAITANVRAGEANRTAKDALDLQATLDRRSREFRDVVLWGEWENHLGDGKTEAVFGVHNTGLTSACSVTLALSHDGRREMYELGDIEGQSVVRVAVPTETWTDENGREQIDQRVFDRTGYRLHWSSPLGQVESFDEPVAQDPQVF